MGFDVKMYSPQFFFPFTLYIRYFHSIRSSFFLSAFRFLALFIVYVL